MTQLWQFKGADMAGAIAFCLTSAKIFFREQLGQLGEETRVK